ncbi:DNA-processing protein DprA [Shewanella frigidimarina]|uniref:DNA-processing protein DprA n=1 Tax=Shewanella frigidimarina TaxID=56812 RepID=UPI003D7BA8DA
MNKALSENTKAILLLTSYFNSSELRQFKPLTANGYGYFARWLATFGYKPSDLLEQKKLAEICSQWQQAELHNQVKQKVNLKSLDRTIADITVERLNALLGRGASMSMALEKWSSAGIWILDRSHPLYPSQVKQALKDQAPAVLFGVGNPALLQNQSIGFVGSRDCQQQDLDATSYYVKTINDLGYQVVSGAAKGIDSHAMLSSLQNGNTSIGVMADSLFKASTNRQWRQYLKDDSLALITPFYPEALFTGTNAMLRNKYIYLLSSVTCVVCSGETGGTWEGAKENLKQAWVPLLVSSHQINNQPGNQALLNGLPNTKLVAQPLTLTDSEAQFQQQLSNKKGHSDFLSKRAFTENQTTMFNQSEAVEPTAMDSTKAIHSADTTPATIITNEIINTNTTNAKGSKRVSSSGYASKDEIDCTDTVDTVDNIDTVDSIGTLESERRVSIEPNTTDLTDDEQQSNTVLSEASDETTLQSEHQIEPSSFSAQVLAGGATETANHVVADESANTNVDADTRAGADTRANTSTDTQQQIDKPAQGHYPLANSPLLESFYHQLYAYMQQEGDKSGVPVFKLAQIESQFPDFQIMGKSALDKTMKHFEELELLLRPNERKKEYRLPRAVPYMIKNTP